MSRAEELAQAYADATAAWHVENLYGGSKSYTAEKQKEKATAGEVLFEEIRRLSSELAECKAAYESQFKELHALKAGFEQAITDPENQPSQYGTITLEAHAEKVLAISVKYDNAVAALISARGELAALKASIGEPVAWLAIGIASKLPQALAFSESDAIALSVNCTATPLYAIKDKP